MDEMTNIQLLYVLLSLVLVILFLVLVGKAFHIYQSVMIRRILLDPARAKNAAAVEKFIREMHDFLIVTKGWAIVAKNHAEKADRAVDEVRAVADVIKSTQSGSYPFPGGGDSVH